MATAALQAPVELVRHKRRPAGYDAADAKLEPHKRQRTESVGLVASGTFGRLETSFQAFVTEGADKRKNVPIRYGRLDNPAHLWHTHYLSLVVFASSDCRLTHLRILSCLPNRLVLPDST